MNTARYLQAGCGVSNTAALTFGGGNDPPSALTEQWNGSTWIETGDLSTARYGIGGSGTSSSALGFGGYGTDTTAATEEWSGTSSTTNTVDTD